MIRLLYSLLAKEVIVDRETNTASAVKIIETVNIRESDVTQLGKSGLTWYPLPMYFLAVFQRDSLEDESEGFTLTIETPNEERIPEQKNRINFKGKFNARCKTWLPGIPAKGSGDYSVILTFDGKEHVWRFKVKIVTSQALPGAVNENPNDSSDS